MVQNHFLIFWKRTNFSETVIKWLFYPATHIFFFHIATKLRPKHDARPWGRLKSLCHQVRKEYKGLKLSSDHFALGPALKGRALLILISSTSFLLLPLLSSSPASHWAASWLVRCKIKTRPVSCHGSKRATMATNDFRTHPESTGASSLDGRTGDWIGVIR